MPIHAIEDFVNQVHLGIVPNFLKQLPKDSIELVITSPPFYDTELYLLDGDVPEFGWKTYEEYLQHLYQLLDELYRITKPSCRVILVLSNTPQTDSEDNITHYWPIIHDLIAYATKHNWIMIDEIIWAKKKPAYDDFNIPKIPETQLIPNHDVITVLRKPGPTRITTGKQIKKNTIWELPKFGPISKYNTMYPSFPNKLVDDMIQLWSIPNDIILDPYAGSGQVVRRAINLERYGIGIESDSRWIKLWEDINN